MTNTGTSNTGGQGYVGVQLQPTYGTFLAPGTDNFLPVNAPPTLASKYDKISKDVYAGSVDTNRQQRVGKAKVGGNLAHDLYSDLGIPLLIAALGQNQVKTAVASDTISTVTTTGGKSSIVLTTGSGTYTVGAWTLIGSGASQEIRRVISWTSGTKTLVVGALSLVHGAGTTVVQPQQIRGYTSPQASSRLVSVEECLGGVYSNHYLNGYVNKYDLKAQKDSIGITEEILFDAQRVEGQVPTAYATTSLTDQNLANAFAFTDCLLIVGNDDGATGASSVSQSLNVEDYSLSISLNCTQKAYPDGNDFYRVFQGGKRVVSIDYALMNGANRPAIWSDFVKGNVEAAFYASHARNTGTPSNPSWVATGFYAANVHYDDAEEIRVLDDPIGETVKCTARNNGTNATIEVFILNAQATAGTPY